MAARPTKLIYQGKEVVTATDEHGKPTAVSPDRFFHGVPARDLNEDDIARLSDEDLKDIMGGNEPLYVAAGNDDDDDTDEQSGDEAAGYEALTVAQLREEADKRSLDVPSSAKKADLVAALEASDAQKDSGESSKP